MPQTELHLAAQDGRVADVERLIAARAHVNAKDEVGAARRPPRSASPLTPSTASPFAPPHPAARRGAAVGTLGAFWGAR